MEGKTEPALSDLLAMEPFEFEHFIAELWRQRGYRTTVSQQSVDGGVDVVAKRRLKKLGIQAKRYDPKNPVGVRTIREMAGVANRPEYDGVAIATTSSFTRGALREAHVHGVGLYDGEQLVNLKRSIETKRWLSRGPLPWRLVKLAFAYRRYTAALLMSFGFYIVLLSRDLFHQMYGLLFGILLAICGFVLLVSDPQF